VQRNIKIILVILVLIAAWVFYEQGENQETQRLANESAITLAQLDQPATKPSQINALEKNKPAAKVELPDFAAIQDVNQKKQAFVDFILPGIHGANKAIRAERDFLKQLKPDQMSAKQKQRFEALAEKYQQPQQKDQTMAQWHAALLKKVDIIPPALALAQAANESAWGTSRFAVDGMNFFGQWCFSVGCGLVPERRPEGQIYEVRLFSSPEESVAAYMLNLNAFHTYEDLRDIRENLRENNKPLNSKKLAEGLMAYSIKREEYINELQAMIRFNKWQKYDPK
jgi:Bax protein